MSDIPFGVSQLVQDVGYEFVSERRAGNRVLDLARGIVLLAVAQLKDSLANREHDLRNSRFSLSVRSARVIAEKAREPSGYI